MQSDDALIARLRSGDTDALAEFVESRRPQLLAYISRNLGSSLSRKIEPQDILQEVSIDCVRALPQVDLSERDPFSWLCQVAERRIIDAHRKHVAAQKRSADREVPLDGKGRDSSQRGMIDFLVASMTTASQAFSRDQRHIQLQVALEKLPADHREALRLRYVVGMPTKQIAEKLGKSDGAVRVMLTRTLNRLQEILGPEAAP